MRFQVISPSMEAVKPSMMFSPPVGPFFPQGYLASALWFLPESPFHKATSGTNHKKWPFKSAHLAHLGVPGGHQNLADASALLKILAHAIMALFSEQVEVLLGCLSLDLGLPGLSSLPHRCLC